MENEKKPRKPGSGRTKGAVSIVNVTMGDLLKVFSEQKKTPIAVSRKFVEQFGIPYTNLPGQNAVKAQPKATAPKVTPKASTVKVKTVDFSKQ